MCVCASMCVCPCVCAIVGLRGVWHASMVVLKAILFVGSIVYLLRNVGCTKARLSGAQVSSMSFAEDFSTPVDTQQYPDYLEVLERARAHTLARSVTSARAPSNKPIHKDTDTNTRAAVCYLPGG